jgi:peptide/nickel transport system ATP-binding protein
MTIQPGEIVGIVGESGSGKSVMSQSILRLRDQDTAIRYEGTIYFQGEDLLSLPMGAMRKIRGNQISVIFQDPMTSLSPVHTVGHQLKEVLRLHRSCTKSEATVRAEELLALTGIPYPSRCLKQYPYELSGGMQQRVMIAIALAGEPKLLIADEPTTALDVTTQEQILDLIRDLNEKLGMAVLFITHDMDVVSRLCSRVMVMYLGHVVEEATTQELFRDPGHPYTRGLLSCIPREDTDRNKPLPVIGGSVPPLSEIPKGCHFCTRCSQADEHCHRQPPPMYQITPGHGVKCWKFEQIKGGDR